LSTALPGHHQRVHGFADGFVAGADAAMTGTAMKNASAQIRVEYLMRLAP
jgi:hypothetical protein